MLSPQQEKLLQDEIVALNLLIKNLESIEASKDDLEVRKNNFFAFLRLFEVFAGYRS